MSLATDIGTALPLETGLTITVVATRTARLMELSEDDVREVFYLSLFRHAGCPAGNQNA